MAAIRFIVVIGCALWLMIGAASISFGAEAESILIQNAQLVSPGNASDGVVVSLLVRQGKLRLVSKDEIPTSEATIAFDAENGYLVGNLSVGWPAGFLILDQDPRKDVNVLLNTAAHVRFAISEGEIVRNDLPALPIEAEGAEKRRGWLAYSPPPMALPVSYGDETKWNRWETRWLSGIFIAALILDRMHWLDQDDASTQQVGDLKSFDGGEIRAFRFGAVGTLNFKKPWVYTVFLASKSFDRGFDTRNDDNYTWFDYRLDIPLPAGITLSVGKQKAPISMERLMPLTATSMQERSISADAMLTARDVGILLSGTGFNQRMTWAGGVFNDWFDAGAAFGDRATQAIGRVTALAFATPDESNLVHVGFGGRYTNAKQGIQYARKPEFNKSELFVDTGPLEADDAVTWVGELVWRRGPFWIESEFIGSSLHSEPNGDPHFWGYHVSGSWSLTGEMRGYNRRTGRLKPLPVARSVQQGGWGAWELSARWSELDLNDQAVAGGRIGIASLGLTWWLSPTFSFGLNYRHIRLERGGLVGHSDGLNARLFLSLE